MSKAKRFPYRLIEIDTPRGTKRLHHDTRLETVREIAQRYGWQLTSRQGRLAMVAQGNARDESLAA